MPAIDLSLTETSDRSVYPHTAHVNASVVLDWNQQALDAVQATAATPPFASRALALESIAVFDVLNAIQHRPGYLVDLDAPHRISATAAVAAAAKVPAADVTLGLRAGNEGDTKGWKKFRNNPVLSIEYNTKPKVPTNLSTNPSVPCAGGRVGAADVTLRAVPADERRAGHVHVDLSGAAAAGVGLVALVFGLGQTATWGWSSPGVLGSLVVSVVAFVLFVLRERRSPDPLMDFALLRRSRNYLGATISQALAGMAEMGLGLIFPLLLILNLEMDPALAGLALIPTTLPMVLVAPLVGRWYDRSGGRPPLVVGFGCLAVAGVLLAFGAQMRSYPWLLPGLLAYGIGLAIVLTVNDPVSIDTVPERDHGQASGVSATAEQGGGAIGIALLYSVFHSLYVTRLHGDIAARDLPPLDDETGPLLRDALDAAEQVGLDPATFDPRVSAYLDSARTASDFGYSATFLVTTVLALVGLVATATLVRRPAPS